MKMTPFVQKHKILKEIFRNYMTLSHYAHYEGIYTVDYGPVTISFFDLRNSLKDLSPRKKEAVFLNVILDMKQRDVAKIMGIREVTVGQYVDQAMIQVAEKYFPELDWDILSDFFSRKEDIKEKHERKG